jgi:hypothetical protein
VRHFVKAWVKVMNADRFDLLPARQVSADQAGDASYVGA